jgi:ElaB/YqjD/DUF883 family membrane-anchored ribosome-binding protein
MSKSANHSADFEEDDGASVGDILEDLRTVVRDAEKFLHSTEGHAGERIAEVRSRIEDKLEDARERLHEEGAERLKAAAHSTETYVRENPWTALLIAAGLGYLIGNLGRRR